MYLGTPVTLPKLTLLDDSPAFLLHTKSFSPSSFPAPTHLLLISQSKQETTRVQNAPTSVRGCPCLGYSHSYRAHLVGSLSISIKGSFSLLCVQPSALEPVWTLLSVTQSVPTVEIPLQGLPALSVADIHHGSLWGHPAPAPLLSSPLMPLLMLLMMVSDATIFSWMTVVASHWVSALPFSPAIHSQHSTVRCLTCKASLCRTLSHSKYQFFTIADKGCHKSLTLPFPAILLFLTMMSHVCAVCLLGILS